ncbi:unnamed protein product, partial [Pleuronectes platessa]
MSCHESDGCDRSPFTSGDAGMDGTCSSSWAVGPTVPSDSPHLYDSSVSSVDRPKEQAGIRTALLDIWSQEDAHRIPACAQ